ncbi:hypothetical protein ACWERW_40055 [Streptomyces sp. NPDC004012]
MPALWVGLVALVFVALTMQATPVRAPSRPADGAPGQPARQAPVPVAG